MLTNILQSYIQIKSINICLQYLTHIDKYVLGYESLSISLTKQQKKELRYAIVKRHIVFNEIMLCSFLLNYNMFYDNFEYLSTIIPYVRITLPMELSFSSNGKSITYYFITNLDKPLYFKSFYLDSKMLNIHLYNYDKLKFPIKHDICIHNPQKLIPPTPKLIIDMYCKSQSINTDYSINSRYFSLKT